MLRGLIILRGMIANILSTPMSMYGAVACFCFVWRGCCRLRLSCVTTWNCVPGLLSIYITITDKYTFNTAGMNKLKKKCECFFRSSFSPSKFCMHFLFASSHYVRTPF
jgi:hypothetical protein